MKRRELTWGALVFRDGDPLPVLVWPEPAPEDGLRLDPKAASRGKAPAGREDTTKKGLLGRGGNRKGELGGGNDGWGGGAPGGVALRCIRNTER